jgi:hypothetical protein
LSSVEQQEIRQKNGGKKMRRGLFSEALSVLAKRCRV